jgi:hypothetical protein
MHVDQSIQHSGHRLVASWPARIRIAPCQRLNKTVTGPDFRLKARDGTLDLGIVETAL